MLPQNSIFSVIVTLATKFGVQNACKKIVQDNLNWTKDRLEDMIRNAEDPTQKQDAEQQLADAQAAVKIIQDAVQHHKDFIADLEKLRPQHPDDKVQLEKLINSVKEALQRDQKNLDTKKEERKRAQNRVDMFSEACIKVMKEYLAGVKGTVKVTTSDNVEKMVLDDSKAGAGGARAGEAEVAHEAGAAYKPKQGGAGAGKQPKQGGACSVLKPPNAHEGGASLRRSQRVRFRLQPYARGTVPKGCK